MKTAIVTARNVVSHGPSLEEDCVMFLGGYGALLDASCGKFLISPISRIFSSKPFSRCRYQTPLIMSFQTECLLNLNLRNGLIDERGCAD